MMTFRSLIFVLSTMALIDKRKGVLLFALSFFFATFGGEK